MGERGVARVQPARVGHQQPAERGVHLVEGVSEYLVVGSLREIEGERLEAVSGGREEYPVVEMPKFVVRVVSRERTRDEDVYVWVGVRPVRDGCHDVSYGYAHILRGLQRDDRLDGHDSVRAWNESVAGRAAARLYGGVIVQVGQVSEEGSRSVGVGEGLVPHFGQEESRRLRPARSVSEHP